MGTNNRVMALGAHVLSLSMGIFETCLVKVNLLRQLLVHEYRSLVVRRAFRNSSPVRERNRWRAICQSLLQYAPFQFTLAGDIKPKNFCECGRNVRVAYRCSINELLLEVRSDHCHELERVR